MTLNILIIIHIVTISNQFNYSILNLNGNLNGKLNFEWKLYDLGEINDYAYNDGQK